MQEEFSIAFRPKDRRIDDLDIMAAEFGHGVFYFFCRCQLGLLVANNTAFTDRFSAYFKLRFHQNDDLPSARRKCSSGHGGQD